MHLPWLEAYEKRFRPFTDDEAWTLFRLAAYAEAGGWTLLISGLGLKQYVLHGNNIPVLVAGQIHGTLFIIYIVACALLYPSLRWSRPGAMLAGLASVPPYGSLIFEWWAAHRRGQTALRHHSRLLLYRHFLQAADA